MSAARLLETASARVIAPGDPNDVSLELEAIRSHIETRFTEAGRFLAETLDVISRLIEALRRLSAALDADTVAQTTRDLLATAERLHALPASQAERQRHLARLSSASDALREPVDDMRRVIKYLRIFTINVKITSSGIAGAAKDFAVFADDMASQLNMGGVQLDQFHDLLEKIDQQLKATLVIERDVGNQASSLVPDVPDRLAADARMVDQHHRNVAMIAESTAALAQRIQTRVGQALAALQTGDATRQRIEHVQTGLRLIKINAERLPAEGDARERLSRAVMRMLADQMADMADDFSGEVERFSSNVAALAADSGEVLPLREVSGSSGEQRGRLDDLVRSVQQAVTLVRNMRAATHTADDFNASTRVILEDLIHRVAAIRRVREDIQIMSTNTQLRCKRLGEAGKPLGVIAYELTGQARQIEASADKTLENLRQLDVLISAAELDVEAGLDETLLEDAARRLRAANDVVERDISGLANSCAWLSDALSNTQARLGFGRELGDGLRAIASRMAIIAGPRVPETDDIAAPFADILDGVAAVYTMARERTVHGAYRPCGGGAAPKSAASEDLMDDVLF